MTDKEKLDKLCASLSLAIRDGIRQANIDRAWAAMRNKKHVPRK